MPRELRPEQITHLIIHCSDSKWGDEKVISDWHRQRGFDYAGGTYTGYHFVILNGHRTYASMKDWEPAHGQHQHEDDGTVQEARPVCWWGCHALGYNERSLGICLIGVAEFTPRQMASLERLVRELMAKYHVPAEHVLGHYETSMANGKTCPNFDVSVFRARLAPPIVVNPQEPKEEK